MNSYQQLDLTAKKILLKVFQRGYFTENDVEYLSTNKHIPKSILRIELSSEKAIRAQERLVEKLSNNNAI